MSDFKNAYSQKTRIKRLPLSDDTKLIIMSDMHRGDGTGSDDFAHNSLVYKCALDYYLDNEFTYLELGDAEELWENCQRRHKNVSKSPVQKCIGSLVWILSQPDPCQKSG